MQYNLRAAIKRTHELACMIKEGKPIPKDYFHEYFYGITAGEDLEAPQEPEIKVDDLANAEGYITIDIQHKPEPDYIKITREVVRQFS